MSAPDLPVRPVVVRLTRSAHERLLDAAAVKGLCAAELAARILDNGLFGIVTVLAAPPKPAEAPPPAPAAPVTVPAPRVRDAGHRQPTARQEKAIKDYAAAGLAVREIQQRTGFRAEVIRQVLA